MEKKIDIITILLFIAGVVLIISIIGGGIYWFYNKNQDKKEDIKQDIKQKTIENQACDYNPVCGIDNKTYVNKCRANVAGVEIAYDGVCNNNSNNNCINIGPVCGVDNKTYDNSCDAKVEILHNGQCNSSKIQNIKNILNNYQRDPNRICTMQHNPVCGLDNKTYSNRCGAGELFLNYGYCNTSTECNNLYDLKLVCGKDGKTYSNSCRAKAHGVDILNAGICTDNSNISCSNIGPVCGVDNVTYNNSCDAKIEILHKGLCVIK
jgi:coxsackievirus/adenovirus receptor